MADGTQRENSRRNFHGCLENVQYNGVNVIDLAKNKQLTTVVRNDYARYLTIGLVTRSSHNLTTSVLKQKENSDVDHQPTNQTGVFHVNHVSCEILSFSDVLS